MVVAALLVALQPVSNCLFCFVIIQGKVVRELYKLYPDMQGSVRSSIAKYSLDLEDLTDLSDDGGLRQLAPLNRIPNLSSSAILYESIVEEPELVGPTVRCKPHPILT